MSRMLPKSRLHAHPVPAVMLALALFLGSCTGDTDAPAAEPSTPLSPSETKGTSSGSGSDLPPVEGDPEAPPPVFADKLWKDRPVVDLTFDVSRGLDIVTGTETVTFRPDLRTCKVVFRQWTNKPETIDLGNESRITAATVNGEPVSPEFKPAGSTAEQGSLAQIKLPSCLRPGDSVTIGLEFELTLGRASSERIGYNDDLVWLATAFPLLAWERERGWARNPVVDQFGEMTTSEQFRLDSLQVVVPEDYAVIGTGRFQGRTEGPREGTAIETFTAPAVRDVAVTAGKMGVVTRELDNGVLLHVGGPDGLAAPLERWADENERAIDELTKLLGPFPYSDLWVSVFPDCPSGIEFPGAVQYIDIPASNQFFETVVSHEIAHMWFYGLIGNNQGRDPWLDESFTTWAELTVNDQQPGRFGALGPAQNQVGRSMLWYSKQRTHDFYASGVYGQGAQMLFDALDAAGPQQFDQMIRRYIARNAHSVATADDVRRAFRSSPEALAVLREYGAFR